DRGRARWEFRELYARPMHAEDIAVSGMSGVALDHAVRRIVAAAPNDAVLRIRVTGELEAEHLRVLRAAHVRTYAPATMNLEIRAEDGGVFGRGFGRRRTDGQRP